MQKNDTLSPVRHKFEQHEYPAFNKQISVHPIINNNVHNFFLALMSMAQISVTEKKLVRCRWVLLTNELIVSGIQELLFVNRTLVETFDT